MAVADVKNSTILRLAANNGSAWKTAMPQPTRYFIATYRNIIEKSAVMLNNGMALAIQIKHNPIKQMVKIRAVAG